MTGGGAVTGATSNRAARRQDHAEQRRRLRRMGDEAQGRWNIEIVRSGQHRPETIAAVAQWCLALRDRDRVNHLCLFCDTEFGPTAAPPAAFCFLRPGVGAPSGVSISGICDRYSARSDEKVLAAVLAVVKRDLMRDARVLPAAYFHADGGRA